MIIQIINVKPNVSKNIAKTINDIRAIIPATMIGLFIKSSNSIENNITNNAPITRPRVVII